MYVTNLNLMRHDRTSVCVLLLLMCACNAIRKPTDFAVSTNEKKINGFQNKGDVCMYVWF